MGSFDELLAELLDEPEGVLGALSDVVSRGRMAADDLDHCTLDILTSYDLVVFLITRSPRRPIKTWVYPSPLGLKVFATLEREAEREEERQAPPSPKRGRGRSSKAR